VVTFKIKAIHFLNQKLKDPEEAVKPSLAVLWAVTYVCVIEVSAIHGYLRDHLLYGCYFILTSVDCGQFLSDNNDELKIHLSGVRRIIELRGRFQAFSSIIIYWILGYVSLPFP
jgi:hypothetical protein